MRPGLFGCACVLVARPLCLLSGPRSVGSLTVVFSKFASQFGRFKIGLIKQQNAGLGGWWGKEKTFPLCPTQQGSTSLHLV